jgi:hypothetical protein
MKTSILDNIADFPEVATFLDFSTRPFDDHVGILPFNDHAILLSWTKTLNWAASAPL